MATNHILYISYDGMTDPLGQSQVLPYITGLSREGYRFTLISCEKPDRYRLHRKAIQEICDNAQIDWYPLLYHKTPPIVSTLWDLWSIRQKALLLHRQKGFSLVHCRGYIPSLIGLEFKKKRSVPFLFDMRGFWADEKKDAGAWNTKKWIFNKIYQYFKQKEKEFNSIADAVVSLTHKGKVEILSWGLGIDPSKITVIPCCVDTEWFDYQKISPSDQDLWRKKLGLTRENRVVSYLGSFGTWYMLDEMLDFFKIWKARYPSSKMLLITHDEHSRILEAASQRDLVDDIIIQPAQRKEVPILLSLSEVSLFFIRPTYSKMSSSPTKQGEIMAMGIPIFCNSGVGDTDQIVKKYDSGNIVDECKPEDYQRAIDAYQSHQYTPEEIRKGAIDYFDLGHGVSSYLSIYRQVLN